MEKNDLISRAAAIKTFTCKPPEYYHTSYIVGELNCVPAVDAIPVKWLEAQISPFSNKLKDEAKGVFNATIREMIYRWQKEQEAR